MSGRAARNATCCTHPAHDHDTHGCAVNVSTHHRTYERCHGLVPADTAETLQQRAAAILDEALTGGYSHDGANSYVASQLRAYAAEQLRDAAHHLDDDDDQSVEVALGGAPYVHRVLCDRAHALDGQP